LSTRSRAHLATLAAGVLVTLGAGAVEAEAGVIRFEPVADAHVSKAKKQANFGKSKRLVVDGSPVVRSYLRFNVRGLGGAVSYATLQLSVMRSSTGGLLVRRAGANHWGEGSIRYSSAPRIRSRPTARVTRVRPFRTANISVTKLIRGDGVVTLVVASRGKGAASIFSSEGPRILRPQLVVGVNSAPLCLATVLSTTEDAAATVDPACSDVEREPLSYQIVSKGTLGTASIAAGKLRYVPKADANGSDRFTYRAKDKHKWSKAVGVTVIIRPVNDAPECAARTLTVDEDGGEAVGALCTDVEHDPLSYSITSSAQQGKSFVVAGDLRYEPFANTNGTDTFSYRARDASLPSAPATVSVNVRPVNDAPTCANVGLSTIEDVAGELDPACSDIDGDALAYGIAGQGIQGTASVVGGRLRYTPNVNANGADSFTYFTWDGGAASAPATASVSIAAVNDAPVCHPTQLDTPEGTIGHVNPHCTDVEGDSLSYFIGSQGTKGVASVISGGVLRYTPNAQQFGADTFTYGAQDSSLASSLPATVSVAIGAVNDPPVCANVHLVTDEDTMGERDPSCADIENATLTYSIVGQGAKGTASVVAGKLRYVPNLNANGSDAFTYRASDGNQPSAPATVSVTIGAVNDPPECLPRPLQLNEDTQGNAAPLCTDPENDPLTFEIVPPPPSKGSASVVGGSLRYVPNPNANGSDTFNYRADDGPLTSASAPVSVTIHPVNDPPVAQGQSPSTAEDTPKDLTLVGTDVDIADTLTYAIVAQPQHGTLSGAGPIRTYTPAANYHGPDLFTFKVNDGTVDSNVATVSLTVTSVNDVPVAQDQSASTAEDTAKPMTLVASDVEGPLTYTIVGAPAHGTLTGTGANRTYTPAANYYGPDSFTFKVNDGTVDSNVATVSLTVTPVNDPPVAEDQSASTPEDTAKPLTLLASDVESPLTFTILSAPAHGTLSGSGASRTYTPAANYHGPDSFTFKVNDGTVDSNVATVSLTVSAVNDPPVCVNIPLATNEDVTANRDPSCTDIDSGTLSYAIVDGGSKGTASVVAGKLRYAPSLNENGADTFTYNANDGAAFSPPATVSVTIAAVNDAPVAVPQSPSTAEDAAKVLTLGASDVDGDLLSFTVDSGPAHGSLTGSGADRTYTPTADYHGPDSFSFKVNDGTVDSNLATVALTVTPVNDSPVAADQSASTAEDMAKALTLGASDVDGDTLSFAIVAGPAHGTLSGSGASRTYTPGANYHGSDSFTFRVNDGTVDSNVATASLTVTPVNDAPVAFDQTASTPEDTAKPLTLGGSDVESGPLTFVIVSGPTHGTLSSGTGPDRTYTPAANYSGPDSFTFKVNDGTADSNVATVTLSVGSVNDPPVAEDQSASTAEDTAKPLTLGASDAEGGPLTFIIVSAPAHGTLTGSGASRTYTPDANYNGPDSFAFKVNDGTADSNVATVSLTVTPINDAPVAVPQSASTAEDTATGLTLGASDVDSSTLTFEIVTGPTHGTLSGTGPDRTYTPSANYHGPDSFTFRASDGALDSNLATVSLTINPANDAPSCANVPLTTDEDVTADRDPSCTDIDGDSLTYSIVGPATNGTASVVAGKLRYAPAANTSGLDSFTYRADDGPAESAPATVSVTVAAVNDPPVCADVSLNTAEDTPAERDPSCTDIDSGSLTYSIVGQGGKGTATVVAGKLHYAPNTNANGIDTFTYRANDGGVDGAPTTVSVTIQPANDAPVCTGNAFNVNEDGNLSQTACTDVDGDSLTLTTPTAPSHGAVTPSTDGGFNYVPDQNYNGPDSFTVVAEDPDGLTSGAAATITITVVPVNDPPTCNPVTLTTPVNVPGIASPDCADVDNTSLTFEIVTQPAHGPALVVANELSYTPDLGYSGPDAFTYRAGDGTLFSPPADVSVTVGP
jgi:Bacterial Ig domain